MPAAPDVRRRGDLVRGRRRRARRRPRRHRRPRPCSRSPSVPRWSPKPPRAPAAPPRPGGARSPRSGRAPALSCAADPSRRRSCACSRLSSAVRIASARFASASASRASTLYFPRSTLRSFAMPLTLIRASRVSPSTEALRRAIRRWYSKRVIRSLNPSAFKHHGHEGRLAAHVARAQVLGQQLLGARLLALQPRQPHARRHELVLRVVELLPALARARASSTASRRSASASPSRVSAIRASSAETAARSRAAASRRLFLALRGHAAAEQRGEHRERQESTEQPHSRRRP